MEFSEKCAFLRGTNNVQIQVKCKCRVSAKASEGDHLEDVETSSFNIFFKTKHFFGFFISKQFFLFEQCCEPKGEGLKRYLKDPKKGRKHCGFCWRDVSD